MAQSAKVNIDIGSKADTRGFKVAETALQKLNKSVKSLAGGLGIAYGTRAIVNFGKASVKAFVADQKAAKSLAVTLQNTGNSFATIATEGFIARMQQTYKVLDDELRPAFQKLLTATGSVTESQKGLELALNISAGTGKDLESVSAALAKAYGGNTTALSRLGAGLSKATLASGDLNLIFGELNAKFKGQALAATKTYAGQIAALGVAAQNSKEIIGKGLVDAITALGKNNEIDALTTGMEDFATGIAEAIREIGLLSSAISSVPVLGQLIGLLFKASPLGLLLKLGQDTNKANMGKGVDYSGTSQYFTAESAARAKSTSIIKANNAAEQAKLKLAQADLDAKKKASDLDELKKKFDINRINLETALLNSKDDAEKARIQSLLTIMDDDANSAAKRLADLDAANEAKVKAETAAADNLKYLATEANRAALGLASIGNPTGSYGYTAANPSFTFTPPDVPASISNAADMGNPGGIYDYTAANPSFTYSQPLVQNITIEAPNGSEEYLTDAVKRAMQKLNRYGDSTTFAGAL
jgi:hypothetical protein